MVVGLFFLFVLVGCDVCSVGADIVSSHLTSIGRAHIWYDLASPTEVLECA